MLNRCQIVYHHENCLNTKRPYAGPCRLCVEVCPHGAISEDHELNPKLCTECGACMAVCPSDGFVELGIEKLLAYLNEEKTEAILNCPQARPVGYEISCLGLFDRDLWTFLMLQANSKTVEIHTGVCNTCPDKKACALSINFFKELHRDWSEHPMVKIMVDPYLPEADKDESNLARQKHAEATKAQEKGAGEKENIFSSWRQKGMAKLETFLPGLTSYESYSIPVVRQYLVEYLKEAPEERVPFHVLEVSGQCTSCGVCAAICPQGALQKKEEDEHFSLRFEPMKCVHCPRCIETCRPQALSFVSKSISQRILTGRVLIHEGSPRYCQQCGKQVFDNSEPPMCIACASSGSDGFFSNYGSHNRN